MLECSCVFVTIHPNPRLLLGSMLGSEGRLATKAVRLADQQVWDALYHRRQC
jgi:hypothetical protein